MFSCKCHTAFTYVDSYLLCFLVLLSFYFLLSYYCFYPIIVFIVLLCSVIFIIFYSANVMLSFEFYLC